MGRLDHVVHPAHGLAHELVELQQPAEHEQHEQHELHHAVHEQQLRSVLAGQHSVQELRLQRLHLSSGKRCVALQLLHRRLQHLQQLSGPVHLLAPLGRQLPERPVGEPLRRLPDADALQGRHRCEQARLQPRHGRSGTVHHHGLQLPEHRPAAGAPGDGHVLLQGRRHRQQGLRRP